MTSPNYYHGEIWYNLGISLPFLFIMSNKKFNNKFNSNKFNKIIKFIINLIINLKIIKRVLKFFRLTK